MRRLVLIGVCLGLLAMGAPRVAAQASAVAFCYLDPGEMGGALQPTATGWRWVMVCGYSAAAVRTVVSGVTAETVNGDSLAQVGQKLATAAKLDAANRGYTLTQVLLPQTVFVVPN